MKNFFWSLLAISFLLSSESHAARVTSVVVSTPIGFGKIVPGTSASVMTTSTCAPTNAAKYLTASGCTNGTITVQATTTATSNSGRRIIIFFNTRPTSLTGSPSGTLATTLTITSPLPAGCTQVTANTTLQCTHSNGGPGDVKTWTIPVYGTLSSIAATQATGDYTAAYGIKACSCCTNNTSPCINGCPTSLSDARCTNATLFKEITGSIPARIVTGLSLTENTQLNFGLIASGVASGTVTQAGAKTGGITVLTDASRTAGQITVNGEAFTGTPYTFSTISGISLACDTGVTPSCTGAPTMGVTFSFASGTNSRTLNASGQDIVGINGTLTVGANQLPGNYKGTYTVVVNY